MHARSQALAPRVGFLVRVAVMVRVRVELRKRGEEGERRRGARASADPRFYGEGEGLGGRAGGRHRRARCAACGLEFAHSARV